MKMRNRVLAVAAFALLPVVLVPPASGNSGTSGTLTIVSDTQLNKDHLGDIVVGASNVTLDCKGHTVSGPGAGPPYVGILLDGTTGVTVRNCKVTAFENGIVVAGWSRPSSGNTLIANTSFGNVFSGLALLNSSGNTVKANSASDQTFGGFALEHASGNVLVENRAVRNGRHGFGLTASQENTLQSNASNGNGGNGFDAVDGSDRNTMKLNVANNNVEAGFVIRSAQENALRSNTANNNGFLGFLVHLASSNVLSANLANNNGSIGFALNNATATTLSDNAARGNGAAGVDMLQSDSNTLAGNVSSNNVQGGFRIADSSNNHFDTNAADHNGSVGFDVFFGSESNVFVANEGCGNMIYDARDAGTANAWLSNTFCSTSGICSHRRGGGRTTLPSTPTSIVQMRRTTDKALRDDRVSTRAGRRVELASAVTCFPPSTGPA